MRCSGSYSSSSFFALLKGFLPEDCFGGVSTSVLAAAVAARIGQGVPPEAASSRDEVSKFPLEALPIDTSPPVEELQLELGTKTGDCTFMPFFAAVCPLKFCALCW